MEQASELLAYAPVTDWLKECYLPEGDRKPTLASAFGRLIAKIFAGQGLIVIDASTREFHALGAKTLRYAIEHADELQKELTARSEELVREGYHAQVTRCWKGLHCCFSSIPTLVEAHRAATVPLEGQWKAGGHAFSSHDLIAILESCPERLSPNALLRPVFQDTLLPTTAYVGGPAEIAYFAQSAVLYLSAF